MNHVTLRMKIAANVLYDVKSLLSDEQYDTLTGHIYEYVTANNSDTANNLVAYLGHLVLISDTSNAKIQRHIVKLWTSNQV